MKAAGLAFIITIFFLGVIVGCAAGVAWAEQPETPKPDAEAHYAWACKWSAQLQKNRRHALAHARCLGVRLPAKLRCVTECPVQIGDEREQLPWLYDWAAYGAEWKRQAIALARYCRTTRYRMTHPKWRALGAEAWRPLVRHCFGRQGIGWREDEAILVIRRESNGDPTCQTGPHVGLYQFNAALWGVTAATACDPWWNVNRAARAVKEQGGWYPAWAATAP